MPDKKTERPELRSEHVQAKVPASLVPRIDAAAEADGRTRSNWIYRLIERELTPAKG